MKKTLIFTLLCLTLFGFIGCQKVKDMQNVTPSLETTEHPPISLKNGVLVFANPSICAETLPKLQNMSFEQRKEWEKGYNFTSQKFIYDELAHLFAAQETEVLKEAQKRYPGKTEEELIAMEIKDIKQPERPSLYFEALKKGIIYVVEDNPEIFHYELNSVDPTAAVVLNEEGLVMVGKNLIQYTKNQIKIWENADVSKKEFLLRTKESGNGVTIVDFGHNRAVTKEKLMVLYINGTKASNSTKKAEIFVSFKSTPILESWGCGPARPNKNNIIYTVQSTAWHKNLALTFVRNGNYVRSFDFYACRYNYNYTATTINGGCQALNNFDWHQNDLWSGCNGCYQSGRSSSSWGSWYPTGFGFYVQDVFDDTRAFCPHADAAVQTPTNFLTPPANWNSAQPMDYFWSDVNIQYHFEGNVSGKVYPSNALEVL